MGHVVLMRNSTDLLLDHAAWDAVRQLHVAPSMNDGCFCDPLPKEMPAYRKSASRSRVETSG